MGSHEMCDVELHGAELETNRLTFESVYLMSKDFSCLSVNCDSSRRLLECRIERELHCCS